MSGPVDVLAVMREFATRKDPFGSTEEAARQYEVARAAVAELIEAATELRARQRDYLSQPKGERVEAKGRLVGVAATRLDAALARVQGGAA